MLVPRVPATARHPPGMAGHLASTASEVGALAVVRDQQQTAGRQVSDLLGKGLASELTLQAEGRLLARRHYPWLLQAYDRLPQEIMRADFARSLYLHRHVDVQF